MKQLSAAEIRRLYIEFFEQKGHAQEPSASLVPVDDPTLLWINSGVATLKKYFDGRVVPDNPRIVNAQKSIRTNDIENVGKTARHHTFFEMLGNFSIGDYFKREAIEFAWEFLTGARWMALEADKLAVTVHPEDKEAYAIWKEVVGLPAERIIRLEGNFWDIGEGPSGPNSEIFFDRGPAYGDDQADPELYPGGENDRYLEIWNLVFSQFNHNPDGTYTPLPKQNIDTGMGLERMASVLQEVPTNFETDLFMPIIREVQALADVRYGERAETDTAFKIIADHIRTVAFAVGDGALPSNEGRGYVLRRLVRRAVRYAKQIGIEKPFMYELVPVVGRIMRDFYPEVEQKQDFIMRVIKAEEERFHETLHEGLAILESVIEEERAAGRDAIPGATAFRLYDTYGFPIELTEEYAEEAGMAIDRQGFQREMDAQRARARAARQDVGSMQVQSEVLGSLRDASEFIGYDQAEAETTVGSIIKDGALVERASEGETVQLLLAQTPFYAESGGQIADRGTLASSACRAAVTEVKKAPNGQHLHTVRIESGELHTGDSVLAAIDRESRNWIVKNHTATHLLHRALKDVLGPHVNQAGSYVGPDRLRFDFSHFGQVTEEELESIERIVNERIWEGLPVSIQTRAIEEAKRMGATALFGEKYGKEVRVVSVGEYSLELCGGCHVANSAEIGLFKVLGESGIGAGTRRIEAATAKAAYEAVKGEEAVLEEAGDLLKSAPRDIPSKIRALQRDLKEALRESESLSAKIANSQASDLLSSAQDLDGVRVLAARVQAKDNNQLRQMIDDLKGKLERAVIVLGAAEDGKVMLAAGVTPDIAGNRYHAGNVVKHVAELCGGRGGGRPDFAMAGAKDPAALEPALASVPNFLKSL